MIEGGEVALKKWLTGGLMLLTAVMIAEHWGFAAKGRLLSLFPL